jgi:hypothetical protein
MQIDSLAIAALAFLGLIIVVSIALWAWVSQKMKTDPSREAER